MKTGVLKKSASLIQVLAKLIDWATVFLSGYLVYIVKFETWQLSQWYSLTLIIIATLASVFFHYQRVYQPLRGRSYRYLLTAMGLGWTLAILVFIFYMFLSKTSSQYSRIWLGGWYFVALLLLMAQRSLIYLWLRQARAKGYNQRHIVVIGEGSLLERVKAALTKTLWAGYKISHTVPLFTLFTQSGAQDALLTFLKDHDIDEVWLTIPLEQASSLEKVMGMLRFSTCVIRLVPDIFGIHLINYSVEDVAGLPVVNLRDTPHSEAKALIKNLEDKILSVVILLLISPLLLIIAIIIKWVSPGPIFFVQDRYGLDGKAFKVYKFRSMHHCANSPAEFKQAVKGDPRITGFGRFLRATSLDELPQIFNVLQGKMSLVGPRPHAIEQNEHYKKLIPSYMQRHLVKPGITGWAQVNGFRGETDTVDKMVKRIEYDLYYIENWSLWFDLKIIFMTIFKGLVHKNAY